MCRDIYSEGKYKNEGDVIKLPQGNDTWGETWIKFIRLY